jgi:polysaccharide biosynthesis PFTS motif protein
MKDLVLGRWCNALIFCEAVRAKATSLSPFEAVGREYFLSYMGSPFRPLWTYVVENRGARVFIYFNSTSEEIRLPSGYRDQKSIFGLMNWPNYLAWDRRHADLLRSNLKHEGDIKIAGPLYYSDTLQELPNLPKNTVAVFDIQPHKINLHFGISTLGNYREQYPHHAIEFLRDIQDVISELEGYMAWKPKRSQPKRMDGKYRRFIEKFEKFSNVISISAEVSPLRLINNSACVISIPFTSTGVYGKYCGRPSVYYDPTGWIQKDDKAAHGLEILSNKPELREWLRKNLFKKDP